MLLKIISIREGGQVHGYDVTHILRDIWPIPGIYQGPSLQYAFGVSCRS